jgi:hypothetical protein
MSGVHFIKKETIANNLPKITFAIIALVLTVAIVRISLLANSEKKQTQSKAAEKIQKYVQGYFVNTHTHLLPGQGKEEQTIYQYAIQLSAKEIIPLTFTSDETVHDIPNGALIKIDNVTRKNLGNVINPNTQKVSIISYNATNPFQPQFLGPRRIFVIHAYPESRPYAIPTISNQQIANAIFHANNSTKHFVDEVSFGQADLVPVTNADGDEIQGPFMIPITYYPTPTVGPPTISPPPCGDYRDYTRMGGISDTINQAVHNANPNKRIQVQDDDIFVFVQDSPCFSGSGGSSFTYVDNGHVYEFSYINLGIDTTNENDFWRMVTHEIGHSGGLSHANSLMCYDTVVPPHPTVVYTTPLPGTSLTPVQPLPTQEPNKCISFEYGDPYDMIGGFRLDGRWNNRIGYFNGANMSKILWMNEGEGIKTITQSGTYPISYFEKIDLSADKVLRIPREPAISPAPQQYLYVEYRQPVGFDTNLNNDGNDIFQGALIHIDPIVRVNSMLLDTSVPPNSDYHFREVVLKPNSTFTDPQTGTCIKTIGVTPYPNANASLIMQVNLNGPCISNPTPTPTVAPLGACRADVNHDGIVDISDFTIVRSEFGRGCQMPPDTYCGDINQDTIVDISDFTIVRSFFGRTCP